MAKGLKKVYQYDLEGNFIREFENLSSAQFITKTNNLSLVLNKKRNMFSANNFLWSYTFYLKFPKDLLDQYNDRLFEKYNVPIYEYDLQGNLLNEYSSLSKITKIRKDRNNIRSVLKLENKTFKDKIYKFKKYKKLPKNILKFHINKWGGIIVQYDLKGKKIKEWSSAYEASNSLKISRTNINRSLYGQKKVSNGFIWKYKDIV